MPEPTKVVEREATTVAGARHETLDELLAACCAHGRMWLHQHENNRWSAKLTLPTTSPRHTAEVCSGFGHARPHDALRAILEAL